MRVDGWMSTILPQFLSLLSLWLLSYLHSCFLSSSFSTFQLTLMPVIKLSFYLCIPTHCDLIYEWMNDYVFTSVLFWKTSPSRYFPAQLHFSMSNIFEPLQNISVAFCLRYDGKWTLNPTVFFIYNRELPALWANFLLMFSELQPLNISSCFLWAHPVFFCLCFSFCHVLFNIIHEN